MRQKRIRTQDPKRGTSFGEPMAEGIAKKIVLRRFAPEEVSFIKQRRQELIIDGMCDSRIAKVIAKETGWSASRLRLHLYRLCKKNRIPKNPNIRKRRGEYSEAETSFIKQRYEELVIQGMADKEIANIIAQEKGWAPESVYGKFWRLRRSGDLGKNPNCKETFDSDGIAFIKNKWQELAPFGMNDDRIARHIAQEKGWNKYSVGYYIRKLRSEGAIKENPNARDRYGEEGIIFIKRKWRAFARLGMNDGQIAKKIAKEKGWKSSSVASTIRSLRRNRAIGRNPNQIKQKNDFSKEELAYMKLKWQELAGQGMRDFEIVKTIVGEMGWNASTVGNAIRRLRERDEVKENPNRFSRRTFSATEVGLIKDRRQELSSQGMMDEQIKGIIAREKGWRPDSVRHIIRRLRASGELPDNPNKKWRNLAESQLLSGLLRAPEAMEKFGEQK